MRSVGICCGAALLVAGACTLDRAGTQFEGSGGAPAATTATTGGGCVVEACAGFGEPCTAVSCVEGQCSTAAPAGEPCTLDGANGTCSPNVVGLCLVDLGDSCRNGDECQSGHCVAGVCCDESCDDACFGCAGGSCGPLAAGESDSRCDVCDGSGTCVTGAPIWAKTFGKDDDQALRSIATKNNGELALGGWFRGTAAFDDTEVPAVNHFDGVALWFDAAGTPLRPGYYFANQDVDAVQAVTFDKQGRIIACGYFRNTITLEGVAIPASSGEDAFVVAIDPTTGNHVWSHVFGGSGDDRCAAVALDASSGDVVVTGWFSGTDVDFGGHLLSSQASKDVFVVRLDDEGNAIWARGGHGANDQEAHGVAVDELGNAIVVGRFKNQIDFGQGPTPAFGGTFAGFVTTLSVGGAEVFTAAFGEDGGNTELTGVAISDRIVAAGWTDADIVFPDEEIDPAGDDALAIILDRDGTHLWHGTFGGNDGQVFRKVAIDAHGSIVLVGDGRGDVVLGDTLLTADDRDVLLVKLDRDGLALWGAFFGGDGDAYGLDVAIGPEGRIIAAGSFDGTLTIGTVVAQPWDGLDAWLAAFEP